MEIPGLSTDDIASLVAGLARREYNLLLGAGASAGAKGGDGKALPDAPKLALDLQAKFFPRTQDPTLLLPEVYEHAVASAGLQEVYAYLQQRFSGCKPSWHGALGTIAWRRLWTLNIDDVAERALGSSSRQKVRPYSWKDRFRDPDIAGDELQLLHLHGWANASNSRAPDLVFAITEYLSSSQTPLTWHRIFGDLFPVEPFIVVGAQLVNEYDLAEILRRGNSSAETRGRPSLVVLRNLPQVRAQLLADWGLKAVEMTAAQFFGLLTPLVTEEEQAIGQLLTKSFGVAADRNTRVFLGQFRWLRADEQPRLPDGHDFYKGHDPLWFDVCRNLDAPRAVVGRVLSAVLGHAKALASRLHCIYGPRGSGKSTALLRTGRELVAQGWDVFEFRGEEALDVEAAAQWVARSQGRTALLVDGLADFAHAFGELVGQAVDRGLQVIGTERETRLPAVFQDVPGAISEIPRSYHLGGLSDDEIRAILRKLGDARRLGRLTRASESEQFAFFRKTAGRDLLAAMLGVEMGGGFVSRLQREYRDDVGDEQLRSVYGTVCLAYGLGYPLPIQIAASSNGLSAHGIVKALHSGGQLYGLVRLRDDRLTARHRAVASLLVEHAMTPEERFRLSLGMAKALAPYVSIDSIVRRTLCYRICRQLMRERILSEWIGAERLTAWYEGIVREYEWTSRYWEQRALAEARLGRFEPARSFAEHAVQIHKDAFTLNTLGTILARWVASDADRQVDWTLYWEAVAALRESREAGDDAHQHPFVTFFSYTLRIVRCLAQLGEGRPPEVLDEWHRWYQAATKSRYYSHKETVDELKAFQRDWLLLVAG